jgi:hypothetical protein
MGGGVVWQRNSEEGFCSSCWASLSQAWAMPTSNILFSGLVVFSSAMHKHCTARRRYSLIPMSCTPRILKEPRTPFLSIKFPNCG